MLMKFQFKCSYRVLSDDWPENFGQQPLIFTPSFFGTFRDENGGQALNEVPSLMNFYSK
jgi:hypothetical protein